MSVDIREIARRNREELWNKGDLSLAEEIVASNCVYHINDPITPALGIGPEGAKKAVTTYRRAFPDLHVTVEDVIAEGDRVVVRWTSRGTHNGELMGFPPSHMKITVTGIDIYRIAEGRIQEFWLNWDTMGFMQQLGLEPLPARAMA